MNLELRLLVAMLKSGDFTPLHDDQIKEEHFESDTGQTLYRFIRTYRGDDLGSPIYPSLAIVEQRFDRASLDLPELDDGDTVGNLTREVRVNKARSDLRKLAVTLEEVAASTDDPVTRIGALTTQLRAIAEEHQRTPHMSLANAVLGVVEDYKAGEILPQGVAWPWPSLTEATKGMQKGELIVIAGRPKSRKSFTAFRVALHALKHENKRVLIFSPEMKPKQVMLRCIAHLCDLHYREFKDGKLNDEEAARLFKAAAVYGRAKETTDEGYQFQLVNEIDNLTDTYPSLDIVQSTGKDTAWMQTQIEMYEPDIVVFDSLYRQRAAGQKRNDSDWKAITALSRESKDLVTKADVIGIATHQLNRGAERGVGDLSSLALADAFGADADGIYRVVTGRMDGEDVSAIYAYGNRDAETDGVLIKNKPCYDYSEIGPIKNRKQVEDLMKQEDERAERAAISTKTSTGLAGAMATPPALTAPGSKPRRVEKVAGQTAVVRRVKRSKPDARAAVKDLVKASGSAFARVSEAASQDLEKYEAS